MTLAVDPYVWEWANLLLRWLHVIAGIAWIGASLYFISLDLHLLRPHRREDHERGVGGEAWEIHGGGFYHVQKYRVAPPELPDRLLWFKWEAYTTWLSGFALFVVVYYVNADTYLVDRRVAALSESGAILVSLSGLALAWVIYDALCRLLRANDALLAVIIVALLVAAAWGASELLAARAVPIQLGAMLGTIMVGNVFFNIIPAHRELVRAKQAGREPDPAPGLGAKQRSVHNHYLTLPVVVAMIGPHFPFVYGRDHGWLALLALMAIGAWVRHFFNLRHAGRDAWWIPATAAAAVVALAFVIRPENTETEPVAEEVPFSEVQAIVEERCTPCHSQSPTQPGFSSPPGGVALDTPDQIEAQAAAIRAQTVDSRAMPLGNVTKMTDDERARIAGWLESR